MKITILAVGKFKPSMEREIFASYLKRIPWKIQLREVEVKKTLQNEQLKAAESVLLQASIPQNSLIIALDERGENLSSRQLANVFIKWQNEGASSVAIMIGGAEGLADDIRKKADILISFGKLTWPHMLVRTMLAEQIYRIYTIMNNHPYHKD